MVLLGEDTFTESGSKPDKLGTGLVAGHAYSLIRIMVVSTGNKLVQLRNPWGSEEWTGSIDVAIIIIIIIIIMTIKMNNNNNNNYNIILIISL